MVDHPEDEGQEPAAGQAPAASPPAAQAAKWNPLNPSPDPEAQPSEGLGEGERVAKALARAGVASRREVERYIEAGRVALNGQVLTTPAVKVAPGDILTVDGAVVGGPEPTRLFRYHKPAGLITTNSDPQRRPTVFEHLPDWLPRVLAVGRLDLNTEGLLLLTNDGALSRALELPSSGWMRRYRARAYGGVDQAALDRLAEGVTIDGVAYGPIEATLDKATGHDRESGAANVWISIGITEGKNREVRKVLEHLGLKVNRLIRLAYGPFALSTLALGQVEEVGPRVIREQLAEHVAPESLPTGDRAAAPPPAPRARPDAAAPRRATPAAKPSPARGPSPFAARHPPADGAERRLAEFPRKPQRSAASGKPAAKGGQSRPFPAAADRPRGDRQFGDRPAASGKPGRLGPSRGWIDKPGARTDGPRDARTTSRSPDRATTDRPAKPAFRDRRDGDAPREARAQGDRTAAPRPTGKPGGFGPARSPGGFGKPRPGAPGGAKSASGKSASGKPASDRPGRGKPAAGGAGGKAAPAAPSRTGLELTPPMRRTPRGSGPRRPPRKD